MILKFKKEDEEDSDVTKAKKIYQETSDAKKAYEAFDEHKNKCVEAKLLYGLSTFNANDYVNSLEQVTMSTIGLLKQQSLIPRLFEDSTKHEAALHPFFSKLGLEQSSV